MPRSQKKPKRSTSRRAKASTSEVEELQRRLSEARQHRHLLIQAVHGLTAGRANLSGKPDLDTVIAWLIQEIENLTSTRPVLRSSSLDDLKVPLLPLTKAVNDRWFPNGGGFPPIAGSTIVGDLAWDISQNAS